MISIKVNHLVNLQDARYCAALDVAMIGFCLERGNSYRLPDSMIADIVSWLEGPKIVLNFGSDYEEMNEFLPRTLTTDVWHEFVYVPDMIIPARSVLHLSDPDLMRVNEFEWLLGHSDDVYLELDIPPRYTNDLQAFLEAMQAFQQKIILNADAYDFDILNTFPVLPAMISVRSSVEEDLMHLDYDKFEALTDRIKDIKNATINKNG